MQYAATTTSDGYITEMLVLNSENQTFTSGAKIGVFMQINDMSGPELDQFDRIIVQAKTSLGEIDSLSMDRHDYIVLVDTNVTPPPPPPVEEPESTPEETPATTPNPPPVVTSPPTMDIALIISLAGFAITSGIIASKKKR